MDDLIGFLFFALIFILGPLLEQRRRKQQQRQQRPPERRPLPRAEPRPSQTEEMQTRPEYTGPYGTTQAPADADDSAATMLPDDLWEILTGQPRPVPVPPPPPSLPPQEAELETYTREERSQADTTVEVRRRPTEEIVLEDLRGHPAPVVVSMETLPPEPRVRHAAFHEKIDQLAAPLAVPRKTRKPLMGSRADMRRAIVLQAILGTPKGLE